MSENITPTAIQGSDLEGSVQPRHEQGMSEPLGTFPVSPMVPPLKKFPLLLTVALLFLSVLAGISIYLLIQVRQLALEKTSPLPTPAPVASIDPMADWQTYTNKKYGYQFKYPQSINQFDKLTDDFIEIGGLDGLIIQITPILTKVKNPQDWWDTQNSESYTEKPTSCFNSESTSTIRSLYDKNKVILDFKKDILVLNNFNNSNSICSEPPTVQVLLIPTANGILKITYDWALDSENILSTFKFTDSSLSYTCPSSGFADCMPSPDGPKTSCSEEAMTWYKANCPGFQGGAL